MEIERAKAICDVSQAIINSAKVEVEHLKVIGGKGSGFIPTGVEDKTARPALEVLREKGIVGADERQTGTGTVTRIGNTTTHKLA